MNIPISLVFFTSTKGHHGFKEMYKDTLNHLDKQIPLASFSVKIAHIKITPGEEKEATLMADDMAKRGFKILATVAEWSRGQIHQTEYLKDQIFVGKDPSIYTNPHVLFLEDDSPFISHKISLEACLHEMVKKVESSPDILSFRFIRRADFAGGVPHLKDEDNYFWSPYFDFQPSIIRSRDFHLITKLIEDNFDKVQNIQSEMLWRILFAPFSRSDYKHAVWFPDYGETYHLGVPLYLDVKKELKL